MKLSLRVCVHRSQTFLSLQPFQPCRTSGCFRQFRAFGVTPLIMEQTVTNYLIYRMFILYIVVCPLNYLRYFRNKFLLSF